MRALSYSTCNVYFKTRVYRLQITTVYIKIIVIVCCGCPLSCKHPPYSVMGDEHIGQYVHVHSIPGKDVVSYQYM